MAFITCKASQFPCIAEVSIDLSRFVRTQYATRQNLGLIDRSASQIPFFDGGWLSYRFTG